MKKGLLSLRKEDFNIMSDVKVIESLKAQLLGVVSEFFTLLTKGSNVAQEAILDCISGGIIILYILADRLGYSYSAVDEDMQKKLKVGIIEEDTVEKETDNKIKYKRFYNTYLPGYVISIIAFVALIYIYLIDRIKIKRKTKK